MKRFSNGENKVPIEVNVENLQLNPQCAHGPTILFVRGNNKFFACSAYRNRKYCNFFLPQDDWMKKRKMCTVKKTRYVRDDLPERYKEIKSMKTNDRSYCHKCSVLFVSSEEGKEHSGHDVESELSQDLLLHPSKLLKPVVDNKKEAQYFFTNESTTSICNILLKNKLRYVICLGAPRIHEYIKENYKSEKFVSILLDIDDRYYNFNEPKEFCHYNLFNNHFFRPAEIEVFEDFLKKSVEVGEKICIIMDPPFGGRIEPIAQTFQEITNKYATANDLSVPGLLPAILILPYFMEPQLKNHIPLLNMVDYQVTYENHITFQNLKKNKNGSPVRIFTNIPLKKVVLPNDNYKYCNDCKKWVGKWNKHCSICNGCNSKNGATYKHCETCERCVKPTWEHCFRCNRCCLIDHTCEIKKFSQACFICKKVGHKKIECPQLKNSSDSKSGKDSPREIVKLSVKSKSINKSKLKLKNK